MSLFLIPQASSRGLVLALPSMTEPVAGEGGTKGSRRNAGIAGKESYRPHQKTVTEKRSPYPIRSSGGDFYLFSHVRSLVIVVSF